MWSMKRFCFLGYGWRGIYYVCFVEYYNIYGVLLENDDVDDDDDARIAYIDFSPSVIMYSTCGHIRFEDV